MLGDLRESKAGKKQKKNTEQTVYVHVCVCACVRVRVCVCVCEAVGPPIRPACP